MSPNHPFFIIFEEYRFVLGLIISALIIMLPAVERRERFVLRLALGTLFCLVFSGGIFAIRLLEFDNSYITRTFYVSWYVIQTIEFAGLLLLCFKINFTELLRFATLAYAMSHMMFAIFQELFFWLIFPQFSESPFYVPTVMLGSVFLFALYAGILHRYFKDYDAATVLDDKKNRIFYTAAAFMFITVTFINQHGVSTVGGAFGYFSVAADVFVCILFIAMVINTMRMREAYIERASFAERYDLTVRQFDQFKISVDYINVKCHDIRNYLNKMEEEHLITKEHAKELADSISVLNVFIKSGNSVLDMVLADKHLYCKKNGVAFSCMADAAGLNGMDESDVYALFTNILDNATAYVMELEPQKRSVNLSVKRVGDMMIIHCGNPLERELKFDDGLPITTKSDHRYHGFGMKSVRMIAHKYGGDLNVNACKEEFNVDIMLPVSSGDAPETADASAKIGGGGHA